MERMVLLYHFIQWIKKDVDMFIKYDESEFFEFFESEPVVVGEEDTGDWIYTYQKDDFKIVLLLSTYEMYIKISICYCGNIVYTEMFKQIVEINKLDDNILKIIQNERSIIVKKESPICSLVWLAFAYRAVDKMIQML